jgi:hypothetical protein
MSAFAEYRAPMSGQEIEAFLHDPANQIPPDPSFPDPLEAPLGPAHAILRWLDTLAAEPGSLGARKALRESIDKSRPWLDRLSESGEMGDYRRACFGAVTFAEDVLRRPPGAPAPKPEPPRVASLLGGGPGARPLAVPAGDLASTVRQLWPLGEKFPFPRNPGFETAGQTLYQAMGAYVKAPWADRYRKELEAALKVSDEPSLRPIATILLREPWPLVGLIERLKGPVWPKPEDLRGEVKSALDLASAGGGFDACDAAIAAEVAGDRQLVDRVISMHESRNSASYESQQDGGMGEDDLGSRPSAAGSRAIILRAMLSTLAGVKNPAARALEQRLKKEWDR